MYKSLEIMSKIQYNYRLLPLVSQRDKIKNNFQSIKHLHDQYHHENKNEEDLQMIDNC